jgi:dTDP-glucose 4,6-dehydratase
MRVLITGGAGFVGSHLCDRFIAEGYEVLCVDNLVTGAKENIAHLLDNDRFEFLEHNVSEPFTVEGPLFAVLHFASPASPTDYLNHPIETMKVGSYGTLNTLEIAKEKGARFMMASTSEVYGDPEINPQPETYSGNVSPLSPRGIYDEAKRFSEAMTMAYHRYHGVDTRIVRIFNTYGPRMQMGDGRVVPNFIAQALRGEPLTIYMDGQQTRSFQYYTDLVEGIYRLLHSAEIYPVNIGNPSEMTILEFAEAVIEMTHSQSEIIYVKPDDGRTIGDPKVRRPDIAKAKAVLDWQPTVKLADGLPKTIDFFRQKLIDSGEHIAV